MAEPILSIQYSDRDIRDRLQRLQRKVGDLTPAMKNIGEALLLSTDQRFETETDVQGRDWQPLSARTINQKQRDRRILKVLQSTGLMRSRTSYRAERDQVIVGNNDEKAAKHQLGIGVPKREFLGVSDEDNIEILSILNSYLNEEYE